MMIKFTVSVALSLALLGAALTGKAQAACGATWTCGKTGTPPTLDADHSEWADVEAYTTTLQTITGVQYAEGSAIYKCMYDDDKIYLALEIPGDYRFNATDDHHCAAIATMMKIGTEATLFNMGGCPDAPIGECSTDMVPESCDAYRVDIGAHWELSGTEQGRMYDINVPADGEIGSGNDLIANKDDEYSVNPYCRFDDDDAEAGNEWAGAWAHTNPVDGGEGVYKFELSRLLQTNSTTTDAQMTPGETYSFGVAYWDPNQRETGWSAIDHYVTGCGTKWIDLELAVDSPGDDAPTAAPSAGVVFGAGPLLAAVAVAANIFLW
jgi:hypothetical protein